MGSQISYFPVAGRRCKESPGSRMAWHLRKKRSRWWAAAWVARMFSPSLILRYRAASLPGAEAACRAGHAPLSGHNHIRVPACSMARVEHPWWWAPRRRSCTWPSMGANCCWRPRALLQTSPWRMSLTWRQRSSLCGVPKATWSTSWPWWLPCAASLDSYSLPTCCRQGCRGMPRGPFGRLAGRSSICWKVSTHIRLAPDGSGQRVRLQLLLGRSLGERVGPEGLAAVIKRLRPMQPHGLETEPVWNRQKSKALRCIVNL